MGNMATNHTFRTMRSCAAYGLVVGGMLLAATRPAVAQADAQAASANASDADRAAAFFEQAKEDFAADRVHEALRGFRDAWQLSKTSEIAANLAIVEVAFKHHRDAAEHFRYALSHLSPNATAEQKQAIVSGLDTAKQQVLTLVIQGPPAGANISIDGVVIGRAPLVDDVYVEPRAHDMRVDATGYQAMTRPIDGSAGTTLAVQLELKAIEVGPRLDRIVSQPPALHRAKTPSTIPLFVGGGVAVVGAVFGTIFLVKAGNAEDDATGKRNALPETNACGTGTPHISECNALRNANTAVDRNRNLGVVGLVVGGAAAGGALLYWFWPRNHVASEPEASAIVLPGYAAVRAKWNW
jgi:PEGA domain